jgi:crotonobetainyl-CoA:carnitine CoA-transferase CaiB-like acyl-CoA transferase
MTRGEEAGMGAPLEGLRIIDASMVEAGAVCSMLLADHGAEVVLVEPRGGTPFSHDPTRKSWQRGKVAVALDMDDAGDLAALKALVRSADVFMSSLRPAEAAAVGLDEAALRRANPGLIICALGGYGEASPWAGRPYGEALAAAKLGVMAEMESPHRDGPIYLGHPALTYGLAFVAAIDILAALRAQRVTGQGQYAEATLLDAFLAQTPMLWWWNERGISFVARDGTKSQGYGRTRLVTTIVFECADGQYIQIHTGGPGGFKRAMDVLGFGDRIRTIDGPDFAVPLDDDEYQAARVDIYDAFRQRPRDEWVRLFHAADSAALPVLRPGEVLRDEQVEHVGQRVAIPDAEHGVVHQSGPAVRLDHVVPAVPAPAPRVGADNDRIAALAARIPPPRAAGPALAHALQDIRILDFSSFFATGYAARLMSDLGAEVIKVEALGGEQMRPLPDPFEACQRGKRDIAIDFKTPEGLAAIHRLVATADVVMHNLRPGKADKAGIGHDALAAINPRLIYAYLPGYGSAGPKANLKSFAPLLSGWTGLMFAAAGEGNSPVPSVYGNEDYNNGFLGAVAVLMAVEQRHRTGRGCYLECPQVNSSLFACSEHMLDADLNPVAGLTLDAGQMGFNALDRLYRTRDGWLCIACRSDTGFAALAGAIGRAELPGDRRFADPVARSAHDADLVAILEPWFAGLGAGEAFARLDAAGAPCEIARETPYVPEFLQEAWALDQGLSFEQHTIYGRIREVGFVNRLFGTPPERKGPAPLLGHDSAAILAELGYDDAAIAEMVRRRIVEVPA